MDKEALKQYIENLIARGSKPSELARRCGVSDAAMSQFRSGKYGANDDNLAVRIATGLYFYENSRNVVDTVTSYRPGEAGVRGCQGKEQMGMYQQPQRKRKDPVSD